MAFEPQVRNMHLWEGRVRCTLGRRNQISRGKLHHSREATPAQHLHNRDGILGRHAGEASVPQLQTQASSLPGSCKQQEMPGWVCRKKAASENEHLVPWKQSLHLDTNTSRVTRESCSACLKSGEHVPDTPLGGGLAFFNRQVLSTGDGFRSTGMNRGWNV